MSFSARFEPHCHSTYSNIRLYDCINSIKDILLTADKKGLSGVALTDHEALCGHIEFLETAKKLKEQQKLSQNFVCALGDEIYLEDNIETDRTFYHFILIAKNTEGYRALREISSKAWYNSFEYKGHTRVPIDKKSLGDIVKKYPNTLIASTACLGSEFAGLVMSLIRAEKNKSTIEEINSIKQKIFDFCSFGKNLFGDDFYIEVAPSASNDQIIYNLRAKEIAKALKIKMVLGGDAHYLNKEDREIHKAFLNSKDGDREVDAFYSYSYLMDNEEAFANCVSVFTEDEFNQMCLNSLEIMNKIEDYDLFHKSIIPKTYVPDVHGKNAWDMSLIKNKYSHLYEIYQKSEQSAYWVNECLNKLIEIDKFNDVYISRILEEANIIDIIGMKLDTDLFAYFNTFQSYIDLFWECGSIVGPGRGSSVCFLSNYCLGITQLDPLEWKLPSFRFLNEERTELPDIDIDLAPSKRPYIFSKLREKVGETNLLQVATFSTAGSKKAIQIAAKGLGLETEIGLGLAAMVPTERGFTWTLDEMIHGNQEKERKPNRAFIEEISKYPNLLDVALGIESLVVGRSQHASGVIIYNNNFLDTTALMRSPSGDLTTQFSLEDSEKLGDTKFDFLVTKICDKIISCIQLLQHDNLIDKNLTIRQVYNEYLHPKKIDLNDNELWDALAEGNVLDVFQFSTNVGLQAVKQIQPKNPIELMMANALTRLVAPQGQERPIERYVRLRADMNLWYHEIKSAGLTDSEIELIKPYYLETFGCPTTQEDLMLICMNIANFSLKDANKARKTVAKKHLDEVPALKEKFAEGCGSIELANYVWETCMFPQMSYSFARPHALAYSYVALQTLFLATKYPRIYWNCACLISNAGGDEDEQNKKSNNYDKIAAAIGKVREQGIIVYPPNINKSAYTFAPDLKENKIYYGLKGLLNIGEEVVESIIMNRPYKSVKDFYIKVRPKKQSMISLIKSGAFDDFNDRYFIMAWYLSITSEPKSRITLQNMNSLITRNLIPEDLSEEKKIYNFNKYLKAFCKSGTIYDLDNKALNFIIHLAENDSKYYNVIETKQIDINTWDKYYQEYMNPIREWMKNNQQEILDSLNISLFKDEWNKYANGTISAWEMETMCFYYHDHELKNINHNKYGISNINELPEEPTIETLYRNTIPIYKLTRIMGTCIAKDKTRSSVTLLTNDGVINVIFRKEQFVLYDKRTFVKNPDGTKKILEYSWFNRGQKLIINGYRRGDSFIVKKYASTSGHTLYHIDEVIGSDLVLRSERYQGEVEEDNEQD